LKRNAPPVHRLDQAQEQVVLGAWPAGRVGLGDHQVQHRDAFETVTHVKDDADRPLRLAFAFDREQALRLGRAGDTNTQGASVADDFRRAIAGDGGDDAVPDTILTPVEKQKR
jgi:hypothetical protein